MLMALNLLPILPLDGGRIAVEPAAAIRWPMRCARLEPYGFFIVIAAARDRHARRLDAFMRPMSG